MNKQFTILGKEITQLNENLIIQKNVMDKYISAWVRNTPYPFLDNRWYVIRAVIQPKDVLYGSPAAGSYLDLSVQFRD